MSTDGGAVLPIQQPRSQDEANNDYHDTCVICLSPLTSRAIAYPCNHLTFDHACLSSWLSHRPTCPLCNTPVTRVEYDYRSPTDFKTQHIHWPPKDAPPSPSPAQRPPPRRPRTRFHQPPVPPDSDLSLARRRLVHTRGAYSLHVTPRTPLTPAGFRASPALQRKARVFLRRELRVFTHLRTSGRLEFVLEYIVGILARLEVKGADGAAERLVGEVLGPSEARLLLHELAGWMASAFDRLEDWDRAVQYADPVVRRESKAR